MSGAPHWLGIRVHNEPQAIAKGKRALRRAFENTERLRNFKFGRLTWELTELVGHHDHLYTLVGHAKVKESF